MGSLANFFGRCEAAAALAPGSGWTAMFIGHRRYVAFQITEVAVPRVLLDDILRMIAEMRPKPDPVSA